MKHDFLPAVLVFAIAGLPLVGSAKTQNNPYFNDNVNAGEIPQFAVMGGPPTSPDVAFVGNAASGGFAGIYAKRSGGTVVLTVTGQNFAGKVTGQIGGITGGAVAGIVVARTVDNNPAGTDTGVFAFPLDGGPRQTLSSTRFSDPTYAPATSAAGDVVFKDLDDDGSTPVVRALSRDGGVRLTIRGEAFSRMGRPAINTALNVAYIATPAGTASSNIYIHSPTSSSPVVIPSTPSLQIVGDQVSIDTNPTRTRVSFQAIDTSTGERAMCHSDQFTPQGLFSPPSVDFSGTAAEPLGDVFSASGGAFLSRKGYQYYKAQSDLSSSNTQNNPYLRLIGIGDAVGGSTVTDILMSESSLLSNGDALFHLTLANGDRGFYFVTVPEPTTLAMLLAVPAMMTRRR